MTIKPAHVLLGLVGLLIVGGLFYAMSRPTTPGGAGLFGGGDGEDPGGDRTARDVGAVTSGIGTGAGGLMAGIAALWSAGQRSGGSSSGSSTATADQLAIKQARSGEPVDMDLLP